MKYDVKPITDFELETLARATTGYPTLSRLIAEFRAQRAALDAAKVQPCHCEKCWLESYAVKAALEGRP